MSMRTDHLASMPSLPTLYRQAAVQAAKDAVLRRARPAELPARKVVVEGHRVPPSALTAWRGTVGAAEPASMPSVLVHTQVFGAAMALLADPEFPLPLPGLVHLTNEVRHHRPVPVDAPLTVTAEAGGLVPHRAGAAVDMAVRVADAADPTAGPLWEGVSRYLARGVRLVGDTDPADSPDRQEFLPPKRTAEWGFGSGAGRAYAGVSGDWNPIHLSAPTARAFGQRGAIGHGMLLAARMLEGREPAEAGFAWDIAFATPVVLPARVSVRYARGDDGVTHVTGWDARRVRPHFTGALRPLPR